MKSTDRFTHLAVAASKMALEDAELDLDAVNSERFGVIIGSAFGGKQVGRLCAGNICGNRDRCVGLGGPIDVTLHTDIRQRVELSSAGSSKLGRAGAFAHCPRA